MNLITRALHLADAAVALAKVSTTRADDIKLYDEALTVIRKARAEQDHIANAGKMVAEPVKQEPVGEVVMESMGVGDAQIVRFRMNGRIPPVGTKLYAAPVQQAEQEPVANVDAVNTSSECVDKTGNNRHEQEPLGYALFRQGIHTGTERSLACAKHWVDADIVPLYAAPVRTKDLTAQEKANIIYAADHRNPMAMIDAAIAADRMKNGIV